MKIKNPLNCFFVLIIVAGLFSFTSCNSANQQKSTESNQGKSNPDVKRIGMVIKMDSMRMKEYLALHADSNPGVRDLLSKYNMKNFSIFITRMDDGSYYEFGYYEYTGKNYYADMAALAKEPRNIEWLKICDPMQVPFKGESSWKKMQQVFLNK